MTNAVICFIEKMGEGVCVKAAYYNNFLMKNQYVKTVKTSKTSFQYVNAVKTSKTSFQYPDTDL